jgi:glycosidase
MTPESRIRDHLSFLYGEREAERLWAQLQARLADFKRRNPHWPERTLAPAERLTERDAFLITYGDQISEPGRSPLQTLAGFMETHLGDAISGVHLLPFYPYSSDDGFSVIDYRQVNPDFGGWEDVTRIGRGFRLMFDAVINHISRHSAWFQAFLRDEVPYTDYFIVVDPHTDLSQVVRPRALPLLTAVETPSGTKYVWTTFSDDQIDLNYSNPQVLLEIIDLLLFYVERGAEVIRLDAIAYLWKEIGTSCIHLPQTHRVVKLFRAVLDAIAPGVILITETNVPHEENISYFGSTLPTVGTAEYPGGAKYPGGARYPKGARYPRGARYPKGAKYPKSDEAQMVYQFPLAPLVLHAFHTGDARPLTDWAAGLDLPPSATFFNFIASHDGIGVRPAEGLLAPHQIQALATRTLAHSGQVSYKTNSDGSKSAYELNITLFDALNNPNTPQPDVDVRRFLASQVIMLSLAGVPGIYVHSLFGSRNCYVCLEQTRRARSINREKFQRAELEAQLADPTSIQHRVLRGYLHLLRQRRAQPAFHPHGGQRALRLHDALFAVVRRAPTGQAGGEGETVLCLVNVSPDSQAVQLDLGAWDLPSASAWRDLIGGGVYPLREGHLSFALEGYQALWLRPTGTT